MAIEQSEEVMYEMMQEIMREKKRERQNKTKNDPRTVTPRSDQTPQPMESENSELQVSLMCDLHQDEPKEISEKGSENIENAEETMEMSVDESMDEQTISTSSCQDEQQSEKIPPTSGQQQSTKTASACDSAPTGTTECTHAVNSDSHQSSESNADIPDLIPNTDIPITGEVEKMMERETKMNTKISMQILGTVHTLIPDRKPLIGRLKKEPYIGYPRVFVQQYNKMDAESRCEKTGKT